MLWFYSRKIKIVLTSLLLCTGLSGCSSHAPFEARSTTIYRSATYHPDTPAPLSFDELVTELARSDIILLGEKHDDARHHEAQQALMQALHRKRAISSLVLEMLPSSRQHVFAQGQRSAQKQLEQPGTPSLAAIRDTLHWPPEWDWQQYGELITWLLQNHIPMYGANLDTSELAVIAQGAQPLKGNVSVQPRVRNEIASLVRNHHTQSDAQLQAMVTAQQFRDRRMAETLVHARRPAILLAGNVHVNKSIGVPLHLQDYGQHHVASVMLVPSIDEVNAAQADYFWIIR